MRTELPTEDTMDVIRRFGAGRTDLIGQVEHLLHQKITGMAKRLRPRSPYRLDCLRCR